MEMKIFTSYCGHKGCNRKIKSTDGGATWRHLPWPSEAGPKPEVERHYAYASGVMTEV